MSTNTRNALLTAAQLAELLGTTPHLVRKRTRQRIIPVVNLRSGLPGRGSYRYDPEKVVAHLARLDTPSW